MSDGQTIDALNANGWRQKSLPGYIGLIGPLWARREDPHWAYGLLTTRAHTNPAGIAHGGLLTSLLDHALSAIAWEAMDRQACVTVQLNTQFLSAAREGQFLEARGRVVHATSSLVFMQGHVSAAGNDIVAASALLKVLVRARNAAGKEAGNRHRD